MELVDSAFGVYNVACSGFLAIIGRVGNWAVVAPLLVMVPQLTACHLHYINLTVFKRGFCASLCKYTTRWILCEDCNVLVWNAYDFIQRLYYVKLGLVWLFKCCVLTCWLTEFDSCGCYQMSPILCDEGILGCFFLR